MLFRLVTQTLEKFELSRCGLWPVMEELWWFGRLGQVYRTSVYWNAKISSRMVTEAKYLPIYCRSDRPLACFPCLAWELNARRLSVLLELRAYAKWTQAAEWRAIWRQAELVKHSRIEIWLLLIEIFCTITINKCRKSGWRECKAKQLFHIIYYWNLRMVN